MYIFKFEFVPEDLNEKISPKRLGFFFKELLLNWFNEIDPHSLKELKSSTTLHPYSIRVINRKVSIIFYLNLFNPDLASPLIKDLTKIKKKPFRIGNYNFLLKKVLIEDFSLKKLLDRSRSIRTFKIIFLQPTHFYNNQVKENSRFSIIELIFSNLIDFWNEFYDGTEKIEKKSFLNWINQDLVLKNLKLKMKLDNEDNSLSPVGIEGWINFEIKEKSSYHSKFIETLCFFGQLTNIGFNRTMGLGIIKYFPYEYFKS